MSRWTRWRNSPRRAACKTTLRAPAHTPLPPQNTHSPSLDINTHRPPAHGYRQRPSKHAHSQRIRPRPQRPTPTPATNHAHARNHAATPTPAMTAPTLARATAMATPVRGSLAQTPACGWSAPTPASTSAAPTLTQGSAVTRRARMHARCWRKRTCVYGLRPRLSATPARVASATAVRSTRIASAIPHAHACTVSADARPPAQRQRRRPRLHLQDRRATLQQQ